MTARIQIQLPSALVTFDERLIIGGSQSDIELPVPSEASRVLAMRDGQWWLLGPEPLGEWLLNGQVVAAECALSSGDVLSVGGAHLVIRTEGESARLLMVPLQGNDTIAPLITSQLPGEEITAGVREIKVAGAEADSRNLTLPIDASPRSTWGQYKWLAVGVLLAGLVAFALWWIVPVTIAVTPTQASLQTESSLHFRLGDRLFLPQGEHVVVAQAAGYKSEQRKLVVKRSLAGERVQIDLGLLPGIVQFDTEGVTAEVLVDGEILGAAPSRLEIPAGQHELQLRAPRYLDQVSQIEVQGGGKAQTIKVVMAPAWGRLKFSTVPAEAEVSIDGKPVGQTPVDLELDSGLRSLEVRAAGRRPWRNQLAIVAGQTLDLGNVDLALPPPAVAAKPRATQTSGATSAPTASAANPSFPAGPPASRIESPLLGALQLVPAGRYLQGSDRRDQGRRSNETLRQVTITRPFYLAARETTNVQFRTFRAAHVSGIALNRTLDLDSYPVSSVSWNDAVAFCNWLSQREGLPLAYERRDGRWQLAEPRNHGYRLPTEAEWEMAARYSDGQRWLRYSWGDALPTPMNAENLSGTESLSNERGAVNLALPDYRDEHFVVAPVGRYGRNALGLYDLGGNVSEWTHDAYTSMLPAEPATDPVNDGSSGARVIRGANWRSAAISELRLAWRDQAGGPQQTVGFRVARGVEVLP